MARTLDKKKGAGVIGWVGWVVIAALLAASAMLWSVTRGREDARIFDQQNQRLEALETSLRTYLAIIDEPLLWNSYLFQTTGEIDRVTFAAFNSDILSRAPSILMLEWYPRVWSANRERFVQAVRKSGLPDYDILEPDGSGKLVAQVTPAPYYLPVLYAKARPGQDTALGLNVSFSEDRRVWYETSARHNTPVTTGIIPIFVSANQPSRAGLVHSRPVYHGTPPPSPEARWEKLRGWVSAVVTLEELFAESIDKNLTPDFDVLIVEKSGRGDFVIGERRLDDERISSFPQHRYAVRDHDVMRSVQVGEQSWAIVLRPTAHWYSISRYDESRQLLVLALAFTAVVAFSVYWQGLSRRRAELLQADVAAREALLWDVTKDVPLAVYQVKTMVDGETVVTFVSDQVERVLGVPASEVLADQRNFRRYQVRDSAPPGTQPPTSESCGEVVCLHINGVDRWIEHRARYRQEAQSGTLVKTGYWADITELKQRETKLIRTKLDLEAANDTLHKTVEELDRTRGALVQSEKLASLGSMVAGVSHELNTPLGNALLASTSMVRDFGETRQRLLNGELKKSKLHRFFDEAIEAIGLVTRSVERASNLVASFKQMAIDQTDQERRRFDLAAHLENVVLMARERYGHAPWEFALHVDCAIELDSFPRPLEQILGCVIENSVVHGFHGRDHGKIDITGRRVESKANAGQLVEISVQDDGCGIAPDFAQRIFDPFFTTKMGRHVGIGLNTSHRMVTHLLGGNISLDPGSGRGTCVVLRIPLQAPLTI